MKVFAIYVSDSITLQSIIAISNTYIIYIYSSRNFLIVNL